MAKALQIVASLPDGHKHTHCTTEVHNVLIQVASPSSACIEGGMALIQQWPDVSKMAQLKCANLDAYPGTIVFDSS